MCMEYGHRVFTLLYKLPVVIIIHSKLELMFEHTEIDHRQLYIYACVVPTAFLPHGFGKKQELDSAGTTN